MKLENGKGFSKQENITTMVKKLIWYKKSYFARFFIEADSRKKIDELSKKIFKKFSIISTENKEIATRFYIEQKE